MDAVEFFGRSVAEFGRRVAAVDGAQWSVPTPCDRWDVRALVNHLVNEDRWVPPLLDGATIAEVGDRLDGDLLGDDPVAAWRDASEAALAAAARPGVVERTVHLSFGDFPGGAYLEQVATDHVVHAWDLARAIGADERLDPALVERAEATLAPMVDLGRAAGVFGAKVEAPPGADAQTRLLALSGRRASPASR